MGQSCCRTDQTLPGKTNTQARRDSVSTVPSDSELESLGDVTTPIYLVPTYQSAIQVMDAFKTAVTDNDESLVMHLIEEYPSLELLETAFDDGCNALHVAVRNKAYKLILCLLTYGVSPNDKNTVNGDTALHEAVRVNSIKTITLLTKFNADANIANNANETPLQIAKQQKYDGVIELLSPVTQRWMAANIHTIRVEDAEALRQEDYKEQESVEHEKESLKPRDPFANLRRVDTKTALGEIRDITAEKNKLPPLKAWLEKKQSQVPFKWQKRWVFVQDSYLLWNDSQMEIKDTKNMKQRQLFNNCINLMAITDVAPVLKGKTQRKLIISVGSNDAKNKVRRYLWKCATKNDRDFWVKGLNEHRNHMKSIVAYLNSD